MFFRGTSENIPKRFLTILLEVFRCFRPHGATVRGQESQAYNNSPFTVCLPQNTMPHSVSMDTFAHAVTQTNDFMVGLCNILAMVVIAIGIGKAVFVYLRDVFTRQASLRAIEESRLEIGHSFSLALALLIGASILRTILSRTWNDIGLLTAIIVIRTGLNYFLLRDLDNIREQNRSGPID